MILQFEIAIVFTAVFMFMLVAGTMIGRKATRVAEEERRRRQAARTKAAAEAQRIRDEAEAAKRQAAAAAQAAAVAEAKAREQRAAKIAQLEAILMQRFADFAAEEDFTGRLGPAELRRRFGETQRNFVGANWSLLKASARPEVQAIVRAVEDGTDLWRTPS